MKNSGDLGGYLSASADNTLLDLHNSSDDTQPLPVVVNYSHP